MLTRRRMTDTLAALSLLSAGAMVSQGLVLSGAISWGGENHDSDVSNVLLIASGAMFVAVMTLRRSPGVAALEMALAGIAILSVGNADHRYLVAYGVDAIVLAIVAAVIAMWSSRDAAQLDSRSRAVPTQRQLMSPPNRPKRSSLELTRLRRRIALRREQGTAGQRRR